MTHFIVVRHGESEGNAAKLFQGQIPSQLSKKGHEQARCSALYLKDTPIDVAYASDLPRAFDTAGHIASFHGIVVTPCEGLREIYGGKWENMRFADIEATYPADYHIWHADIGNSRPTGGESLTEVRERAAKVFKMLAERHEGQTVLIGTHAAVIRAMYTHWLGRDISAMCEVPFPPNASLTYVDYETDGNMTLLCYGEADHLAAAGLVTVLPKNAG